MSVDFLLERFAQRDESPALIWRDRPHSYRWLRERIAHWRDHVAARGVDRGRPVALRADFSPNGVALLLALIDREAILVPVAPTSAAQADELIALAAAELEIALDADDEVSFSSGPGGDRHALYEELRRRGHPGLVLFSSGSTGAPKAAVHDVSQLLEKYQERRRDLRTLCLLLFDHIGGIDTLLYALSNTSCLVFVDDRSPDGVCRAIEQHRVEVLPATPTFLRLLVLAEAHRRHDLSSLRFVTYGTEVMPESTLARCSETFPGAKLLQKYGTTEVGTLRSQSRDRGSTWVRIGGAGFETRVVDGLLEIRARSAMLGYLNAPSPFCDDGWFATGDAVLQEGEFLRILGRTSDIINVGGEKVFPSEVETCLLAMPNVEDATVFGRAHELMGQIVAARVKLRKPEELRSFRARMRSFCGGTLQRFKVPVYVEITDDEMRSERLKKSRPSN